MTDPVESAAAPAESAPAADHRSPDPSASHLRPGGRRLWSRPWGYRESLIMVAGLMLAGQALQMSLGPFDIFLLYRPGNLIVLALLLLLALTGLLFKKSALLRWLSGPPLAVALISGLLLLSLIMGLVPQFVRLPAHADQHLILKLGWAQMTTYWPFVLVYLMTLISLALVSFKRLRHPGRNLSFILNHAGLWLLLLGAGLGAADRQRHVMHVREGEVEWRVFDDRQNVLELPLAIRLIDFDLEEYPPKLAVIDRANGHALPENKPDWLQIDPEKPRGRLLDWEIVLSEYIHQAVPAEEGYRAVPMPAAVPAARVIAKNMGGPEMAQGWVTSGNSMLPVSALTLNDSRVLVMTPPEPKRFTSDIKVFTEDGVEKAALLEVNHPLRAGDWMIYQYSYDNQMGRMSNYSGFELVYDPWLNLVYAGLIMAALGSLGLIWRGRARSSADQRTEEA